MPRVIVLSGPVGWEITAKHVRAELAKAKGGPVEFHINSPGGFVFEGIEIFNVIRDYKGNTTGVITSLAASMGSYIPLACNKVIAYDNATYMIHNALALAIGNHNDMRKVADIIESLSNIIAKAYAAKTGKSLAEVKALMDAESFFFGDEMLHEGFVDEIIEAPEDGESESDKETALASARVSIDMCRAKLRDNEAANTDLERAVAYVDSMSLLLGEADVDVDTDAEYESASPFNPEAPFPNEHACRVRDPGEFKKGSFRRISRKADGKTLDIIIGRLKGKTTTTTQAFRYPKKEWTAAQARKHCKDHEGKRFEPATGESARGGCCGDDNPAGAGQKREAKKMTLAEMLAEHPAAKAEYDTLIATARTEGAMEAKEKMKGIVAKVSPILASSDYPQAIKDLGVKAIAGEEEVSAFTACVTTHDASIEARKEAAAKAETDATGETPGAGAGGDTLAESEAALKAKMARCGIAKEEK